MQGKNQNIKGFGGFTAAIARLFCGCEKHKSGFTLIEVLVVVLIIGILTSVALPQYEKAVEKSRAAKAVSALRTIWNAQRVYYDTYGVYANDISKLDVNVEIPSEFELVETTKRRFLIRRKEPYGYTLNISYEDRNGYCWADASVKKDSDICKSLGQSVSNGISVYGTLWQD